MIEDNTNKIDHVSHLEVELDDFLEHDPDFMNKVKEYDPAIQAEKEPEKENLVSIEFVNDEITENKFKNLDIEKELEKLKSIKPQDQ